MVYQTYSTDVNVEHVIRGNSVVIRCPIPSYVADYVSVDSWLVDATEIFADHWGTSSHTLKHPHHSSLSPLHHPVLQVQQRREYFPCIGVATKRLYPGFGGTLESV